MSMSFEETVASTDAEYARLDQMRNERFGPSSALGNSGMYAQVSRQMQEQVAIRDAAVTKERARLNAINKTNSSSSGGGSPARSVYTPPPPAFSALEIIENAIKASIGVSGMGTWAVDLYNRGASAKEIIATLRYGTDTSEAGKAAYNKYLEVFPKITDFIKEGIFAGESPELQYRAYTNSVQSSAQRYGVDESLTSKDKIANYIQDRISASEIAERMNVAASAVATTSPETISVLRDYYGVQNNDLMSFYLNTDETEAMLKKRYTASTIGSEALMQNFATDVATAESLAERGVTMDEARIGFGQAANQRSFMSGPGENISRENLTEAQFGGAAEARQLARISGSRTGEFQGGGNYLQNKDGLSGLRSASTS